MFDATGHAVRNLFSPEFLEWVKSNNLSQNDALNDQMAMFPAELTLMAVTGDPRGLSILRKGLLSPNRGVQMVSARGLALLQDKDSIRPIIEATQRAPADMQWGIAQPLVFFNDPRQRRRRS